MISPDEVIKFWYEELKPEQRWIKDEALDRDIESRFLDTLNKATRCELYSWRETPLGRLAEIIILDQFSRNIFRGLPASFAADPLALALAQEAVRCGDDQKIETNKRAFVYMPYMHSESKLIHIQMIELFSQEGMSGNLKAGHAHKKIIDEFDRYPHRNEILGRKSTEAEKEFLLQPGSSF